MTTNADIITAARRGLNADSQTGNFWTTRHTGLSGNTGYLPKAWLKIYRDARYEGYLDQVIYSYYTPVAWMDTRYGWISPVVSYSTTTSSKHQSQLWKLGGRHIVLPFDASPEESQRVLDGLMIFTTDSRGRITGTRPGPNYTEGV